MSANVATYYDLLRVSPGTRPDGVRLAYRKLAQKYHPDKLPGNADAQRVMAALNEAYAVLSDPERRAVYDRRIEDAKAHERRARERGMTAIDNTEPTWPWYLLFATIAFAFAAIGIVTYKAFVPGVAVSPPVMASANTSAQPVRTLVKLTKN
jgi:curved DNA-binding protein CbpA